MNRHNGWGLFGREPYAWTGFLTDRGTVQGDGSNTWVHLDPRKWVYALGLSDKVIARAVGESPILYVGQGEFDRPQGLVFGKHGACNALSRLQWALPKDSDGRLPVTLCYFAVDHPKHVERAILQSLVRRHGELPPANLKWEGWFHKHFLLDLAAKAICDTQVPWTATEFSAPGTGLFLHFQDRPGWEPTGIGRAPSGWQGSVGWIFDEGWVGQLPATAGIERPNGALVLVAPDGEGEALRDCFGLRWGASTLVASAPASSLGATDPVSAVALLRLLNTQRNAPDPISWLASAIRDIQ